MNVPMSEEMRAKLISDTTAYSDDIKRDNHKLLNIISAAKSKTITITGLGFELEVYSAIPGPLKDKLAKMGKAIKDMSDYDDIRASIIEVESQFMARMCAEPELKSPDVWVEFETQTGLLDELVECVIGETTVSEDKIKNFRRKL